jgi:hypothetical protein
MSNSKNYNSILFITTLSVYFGLVLVGATPSVLAQQAALTQRFEISNEREIEDDLDKNPDEDLNFSESLDEYFENLNNFFKDLQKLRQIEKFDTEYDIFEFNQVNLIPCIEGNKMGWVDTITHSVGNIWLRPAIYDFGSQLKDYHYLADCESNLGQELNKNLKVFHSDSKIDFTYKEATESEFKINYDSAFLEISVSVKKESTQRAKLFIEKFNQASKIYEVDEEEIIVRKIYENTTFKSENNQVFIVTNLPRAAIDELLADKDAK